MNILMGSDWHFRYSSPKCRTDIYHETISKKLKWLSNLQKELDVPIINGGDITDKCLYTSPTEVVTAIKLLEEMPHMVGICGNHDFAYRSSEYLDKSIISVFIKNGRMTHIDGYYDLDEKTRLFGFDYGMGGIKHPNEKDIIDGTNIAILHEYVSKKPNPLFGKYVGKNLLEEFPEFNIILTGDNHTTFTEEIDGRILINPGSFLRMDSDQINHKPCIYLVDTDTNKFEPIYVPIEDGVISTEHLDIQKDREERISSFVTSMDNDYELSDAFEKNVENYIEENKYYKETKELLINKNVEKFINKSLEGNIE